MSTFIFTQKQMRAGCCLCFVLVGMLLGCGCTQQPTVVTPSMTMPATTTPAITAVGTSPPEQMTTYNESVNGSMVNVTTGAAFRIALRENPTTGYTWNATTTSGLSILDDTYVPDPAAAGMVGVGGTHSWVLKGIETGPQQFRAVYMRPWENVTGSEEGFILDVNVIKG